VDEVTRVARTGGITVCANMVAEGADRGREQEAAVVRVVGCRWHLLVVGLLVAGMAIGRSGNGDSVASTVLEEEILSEAIQSISNVTFEDSESYTLDLDLETNQAYRVRLDLTCEARAFFALSATQCDFGPVDVEDSGNFARWSNVTMTVPG
ncbi:MAG: hypothetical protein KDB37_20295, partial [Ilumatobacter sp.]|nr:hypothetical protein [Ilumatobacter sp.]